MQHASSGVIVQLYNGICYISSSAVKKYSLLLVIEACLVIFRVSQKELRGYTQLC